MKHIHDFRNELREKGWTQRDLPPEVHQTHFSEVTNQMHSWDLSLSKESTSSNTPPTYQN